VGIDEYLNSGSYVFIEWPGLIEPLLPTQTIKIEMEVQNNIRELSIFIG
jgi:tRNA threonylcarbamoyladenosine biosynthesis protein TsaE